MPSNIIIFTALISAVGLVLNCAVFYLVITRGRKTYHYLFAGIIFICAFWDLGILLVMLRNNHPNELVYYGSLINIPAMFLPALIYHFTCSYLGISKKVTINGIFLFWYTSRVWEFNIAVDEPVCGHNYKVVYIKRAVIIYIADK